MLRGYGKEFTWDVKKRQMGMKRPEVIQLLLDMLDLPLSVEEYATQVDKILKERLPLASLLPGAERLITHLNQHQV